MLHTKALVVDGIYSIFGSANFDNRSFELNDELNIAASSPDLARRLLEDFHGISEVEAVDPRGVAPAADARQGARALLELLRGDLLMQA